MDGGGNGGGGLRLGLPWSRRGGEVQEPGWDRMRRRRRGQLGLAGVVHLNI